MKINRLPFLIALSALFLSAYAIVPKTDTQARFVRVTDVERTDSSLRLGVRLQNMPNAWVRIASTTRLISVEDTTLQYKIIGAEDMPLDTKIWMPSSGYQEGTLVFEKVPGKVKVVDMVEFDQKDLKNNVMGIHLDQPETRVHPTLINLSDIIDNGKKASEVWTGLDHKRYADKAFYKKNGTTHLKGRLMDYSPRRGVTAFSIRTENELTHDRSKVSVGDINPDGSFEIDVPVAYPQYSYFSLGNIQKGLFLIPGDTLSIETCMSTTPDSNKGHVVEYFGYTGKPDDGVVINLLTDSLIIPRYGLDKLWRYYVANTDSMQLETYKSNEGLGNLLDSVVADLPSLLGDLPISVFAKDVLSAKAIGKICEVMEDLDLYFNSSKGPGFRQDSDGTYSYHLGEPLDYVRFMQPRLKYKDLIYNNPLMLCNSPILPNRWEFNLLFREAVFVANGVVKSPDSPGAYEMAEDLSEAYTVADNYLDSIGVGNCFVTQLVRTNAFIRNLHSPTMSFNSDNLALVSGLVPPLIRHNDYDVMNEVIMDEYNDFVKKMFVAENNLASNTDSSIVIDGTPGGEVFKKLIAPYKGNVLFLDFWGVGCGPCYSGMIEQKPLLEELAEKPFKALYIANADERVDAAKKWLAEEGIKGEHIFISDDDWKRLNGLFNFSSIPFGVLVGKDGKILATAYHIYSSEQLLKKALAE